MCASSLHYIFILKAISCLYIKNVYVGFHSKHTHGGYVFVYVHCTSTQEWWTDKTRSIISMKLIKKDH